jgi:LacI family transcriptional regulator
MRRKVTLAAVAELAKVAIGTASEALNNKPGVSPETRQLVLDAARQLGYDQRLAIDTAEASEAAIKTIGVIKHEQHDYPGIDPFYFPVLSGVERQCQDNGITMMYATSEVDLYNRTLRLPSKLVNTEMDGLVIVGSFLGEPFAREIRALKCPVVLIDGYAEGVRFDRVLSNNVDGAYDAANYLIRNGHRHIGLIGTSEESYPSIKERREGYFKALARNDIAEAYIEYSPLNRASAHEATIKLLQKHPNITAMFVANDNAAFGVINAARSLGYEVPDNLSVVGFDDISFAQDMVPPLTTMRVDKIRMGQLAIQQLVYRVQHPNAPIMTIQIDTELVIRKSVHNLHSTKKGMLSGTP